MAGWLLAYAPFVLLLALLGPLIWPKDGIGDTFRFWYAGHIVATGGSPYDQNAWASAGDCLLYTSPSPRDRQKSRMPSSA